MSPTERIVVPDLGDVEGVEVVEVLVSAGDRVAKEDPLITLESDKASMDVPSPLAGKVTEIQVKAGDAVAAGDPILTLEVEGEAPKEEPPKKEPRKEEAPEEEPPGKEPPKDEAPEKEAEPPEAPPEAPPKAPEAPAAAPPAPAREPERPAAEPAAPARSAAGAYASPAVRRFARELGVDLTRVRGSGRKGRIVKEDVQAHVKSAMTAEAAPRAALPELPVVDFSKYGETERVELSRIQRISGPRLQAAWVNIPHVTQHDEADITELEAFRQEHKARAKDEGFNLTPLAFVMKAVTAALAEFPAVNASLDPGGEHLILKKYVHLGFAVDTPGGLVVPVIRDADSKGIFELARELAELSGLARDGKLTVEQMRGASFTVTSLGGIGGTFFTPIINPPEVAILGVSRAYQKPVWREGELVPRLVLPLSLSYDHRVVDGAMAVRFTTRLAELLSDLRRILL